ncbi:hypothetical protein ABVL69_25675, partial [Klebsiella pneumoniae]
SVHHIWCPLSSQEYQDLPDGAETTLTIVLPDWSPIEPAMHLYYPGHRQVPQGLKELIEVLRSAYLDVA